ncbi:MAG: fasciclin domain-containing protein, partial [Anaerolineae bacterium]|nr:fasciclin domain-containing protein [Anaerolineae bacterium]
MKARNRILLVLSLVFAVVLAACATGNQTEEPATRTPRPATATPEVVPTEEATTAVEATEAVAEATAEVSNVVETAAATSDFSVLVQAVEAAGLVEALSADGPFTIFAPTDAAFTTLLETLGLTAEELLANTELLTGVLTYHVVAGSLNAADLTNGQTLTTLAGLDLTVTIDGSTVMINDATVVSADVAASNGVIHVIDKVLLPATVTEIATVSVEGTVEPVEATEVPAEATEAPAEATPVAEATETASVEATEVAVAEATEVPATGTVITNVCLVADQGGIKDGNFNALAFVGMQRAEQDFGLQTQIIESDDPADYEPNMETCIRNGANVIVSVGFTQTDAARNIAVANPEVYIIGVDQFYGDDQPANVVSLLFREDQAGFLVGVMAALVTESNIIGGVYGRDV